MIEGGAIMGLIQSIALLKGNSKLIVGVTILTLALCGMFPISTEGFIFGKKKKRNLRHVKQN